MAISAGALPQTTQARTVYAHHRGSARTGIMIVMKIEQSVHQGQNRASYDFQRCWCPRLSAVDTDGLEDPKANDHHYIEQAISGQFESQRWGIFFIWFLAAAIIIGSCTLQWRSEAERDSSLIGKSGSEVGMNRMME